MKILNKIFGKYVNKKKTLEEYQKKFDSQNKLAQQHLEIIQQARDKYDLYKWGEINDYLSERLLIGNEKQKTCVKYKIFNIWDYKQGSYLWFVLYKNGNDEINFYHPKSYSDCKNIINERITIEQEKNNYNSDIIGGYIEEEFIEFIDGKYVIRGDKNGN